MKFFEIPMKQRRPFLAKPRYKHPVASSFLASSSKDQLCFWKEMPRRLLPGNLCRSGVLTRFWSSLPKRKKEVFLSWPAGLRRHFWQERNLSPGTVWGHIIMLTWLDTLLILVKRIGVG